MILVLRTDSTDAYVGIWDDDKEKVADSWEAGRELSVQLLEKIDANCKKLAISMQDISGIIVYEGPGSYTGLRIGISTANAIAYSIGLPIIGSTGDAWIATGLRAVSTKTSFAPIVPVYGGEVHITKPRK